MGLIYKPIGIFLGILFFDARRLFFASIIYLPILWLLMIAGRI